MMRNDIRHMPLDVEFMVGALTLRKYYRSSEAKFQTTGYIKSSTQNRGLQHTC